jgi:hypothetical protein
VLHRGHIRRQRAGWRRAGLGACRVFSAGAQALKRRAVKASDRPELEITPVAADLDGLRELYQPAY